MGGSVSVPLGSEEQVVTIIKEQLAATTSDEAAYRLILEKLSVAGVQGLPSSPTSQYYCNVCKMNFLTAAKLSNHCRFSDIHKKLAGTGTSSPHVSSPAKHISPTRSPEPTSNTVITRKLDLPTLLYTGSKLFWRVNIGSEIHILQHNALDCLEAVVYNSETTNEYNRIYFSYSAVLQYSKSTRDPDPDNVSLPTVQEIQAAAVSYVLSRINLASIDGAIVAGVTASSQTQDAEDVVIMKPEYLNPTTISRRRKTTCAEFDVALKSLQEATVSISEATNKARRLSNLATLSIDAMSQVLKNSQKRRHSLDSVSKPRLRWVHAINKTIRLMEVENMRKVYAAWERKKSTAAAIAR